MVTIQTIGGHVNDPNHMEIYGLSTDEKPTVTFQNHKIINASLYIEMDTGNAYFYDEENAQWYQQ